MQRDFEAYKRATREPSELVLGYPDFGYADLFEPARLAELDALFLSELATTAPETSTKLLAFRAACGDGMKPEAVSEVLLEAAPHVSRFVARLFNVEAEARALVDATTERSPLWRFKKEIAKKRLFKPNAGQAWKGSDDEAAAVARTMLVAAGVDEVLVATGSDEEELAVASAAMYAFDRTEEAKKAGHAEEATRLGRELDAFERWLHLRRNDHHDPAHRWATLKPPAKLEHENLVQLRRPDEKLPELFVGPDHERRHRDGFVLTDRRGTDRQIESEVEYCIYCHERDKDSCSKGLRDAKTGAVKPNPLGVELNGCPLCEKIGEMQVLRRDGDSIAALAVICVDNPMLPGTGHRICNDCMKSCVYQKQDPVNIPLVETAVLTDVLALPWGFEIYGFLTRWNPLNAKRPHARPYNGKNVLVVGLGPAGYTLAHHLTQEGFACVAIDGLKIEPLPVELTGDEHTAPRPVKSYADLCVELDERILLGFGGVSEYGITVRWDKNFLTVLYVGLARQRLLQIKGGVRFGGTLDIEDAWKLGFDHVAIAAGAGRPTIIPMKNNLARGIRKASDFLMGLQLTGAYKRSSLANMQIRLPAVVIGGGLTAIDTATELLAYYVVQVEKTCERLEALVAERGEDKVMAMFDEEEREFLTEQRAHGAAIAAERETAAAEGREPEFQRLLDSWGGVSLVYRKRVLDSPAYRLNHEEVIKSLEEGVRYLENLAPVEAKLDDRGAVRAMTFERQALVEGKWKATGEIVELGAKTICVAAGTSPNVTYEKERPGTFEFDKWKQFFRAHTARRGDDGKLLVEPTDDPTKGYFTSYNDGVHTVSYYGDNNPFYAGSVVKAMASAKDAYPHVVALFSDELANLGAEPQSLRDARRRELFARVSSELTATVHSVTRLTPTIVEVIVHAPAATRKFEPGQFYRLQNYEATAPVVDGTRVVMEGLALTGAWVDKEKGLLSMIALEMGASSRMLAMLKPGEEVVVMGPTGTGTEIPEGETVLLAGGGLGNAVLFSIARALRAKGDKVVYFAGYKKGEDLFKQDDVEAATDQVIWCTDSGVEIAPRRANDFHFRGNIVQAMLAYAEGKFGGELYKLSDVRRIIAIGSDRMMAAVKEARHGVLAPHLDPKHVGIGSINSPMQCMMKEVCAQCLQKHVDPETGKETVIFTCFNQDQELDRVDFKNLNARLRANSAQEKLSNAWLDRLFGVGGDLRRV
ncbi:MAG: FAD-dependent oxidoreductase [Deltaproteobacteria bacterium]|nr:FAD-dependent oxidoreductase [Deltaproteobacteria bacterium]